MFGWIGTTDYKEWKDHFFQVSDFGGEIDEARYSEPCIRFFVPIKLRSIHGHIEEHVVIVNLPRLNKVKIFRTTTNIVIVLNTFLGVALGKRSVSML